MKLGEGLRAARHHLVFLAALLTAAGLIVALERAKFRVYCNIDNVIGHTASLPAATPRPLTPEEQAWARTAWIYFERNTQAATGLVNSVDGYPATTMWDTASALLAFVAAERLGLIGAAELDDRLARALASLAALPLFEGKLPNKSYNTQTLAMVTYGNAPTERGIGWSAIDIARMVVPFDIIAWSAPRHTAAVRAVLARWQLAALTRDGTLYGAAATADGGTEYLQEGRVGYEEYAAKALGLLGLDVRKALEYLDHLEFVAVNGVEVPADWRAPRQYGAQNFVLSEPYVLDGLEFGGDAVSAELAYRVYLAQEARFNHTGQLTAVTEDHVDRPPFFVYNTVFSDGKAWNAVTETGADASPLRAVSVKAAFGWDALYSTPYTARLVAAVAAARDPERGWYAGIYENGGEVNRALTANTNGGVLESLCYRAHGPLIRGSFAGPAGAGEAGGEP